ncbi:unnamed protein product [Rangifer tarandus platyrhynchus]|uniref:Uncharacterized protein n=2 Tax=Rangifer tarandus platyrhynchus TaxID=3082113 RepID=A0ABN8YXJ0_RANTA|nr:unnamed protein product [Rangifer tarandus platyrhynchus]
MLTKPWDLPRMGQPGNAAPVPSSHCRCQGRAWQDARPCFSSGWFLWDVELGSQPGSSSLFRRGGARMALAVHSSPPPSQLSTIIRLSVAREGASVPPLHPQTQARPGRGSTRPQGHCCPRAGRWGALAKPGGRGGHSCPRPGLAPCSVVSCAWGSAGPRRLLSSLAAGLTPSELAGPQGVSAEACRLLAPASDSFNTASPLPEASSIPAPSPEAWYPEQPRLPVHLPLSSYSSGCSPLAPWRLPPSTSPSHMQAWWPWIRAQLPPTWPALPGSVSCSLCPLGTLSNPREAPSSFSLLLLCLPDPPQPKPWDTLNWS